MSSPVGALFQELFTAMGAQHDYAPLISEEQRRNILHALFEGYYKGILDKKIVFDTNRCWCSRMDAIARLFPEARVVVCVRDLAWIMDSFERLFRKNPLSMSKMFKPAETMTVYARMEALAGTNGPVRFAWNALREAFYGEQAGRIIIVEYDDLAREPKRMTDLIYERCGLPRFNHDFNNVSFEDGREFDAQFGIPDLHAVSSKVQYSARKSVLPPDLFERFSNRCFWRNSHPSKRSASDLAAASMDSN